jgi:hypothetical protein
MTGPMLGGQEGRCATTYSVIAGCGLEFSVGTVTFDTDWWEWADEAGCLLNAYLAQDGDIAALPGGTDDER